MRKALIVGVNHYEHISGLYGCVDDAHSMKAILEHFTLPCSHNRSVRTNPQHLLL
jgi:hypothetical protein